MARTSTTLLGNTIGQPNSIGDPVNGAGYYGSANYTHTIAIYTNDFTGRLYIDATLESEPTDADWFTVDIDLTDEVDYLEFTNSTNILPFNFKGNYLYLRARIDRTYLEIPEDPAHGNIFKILLNI